MRPLDSATSSISRSAIRSLSISSASKPSGLAASTSPRIFSRYRSASRNRLSAAVSSSSSPPSSSSLELPTSSNSSSCLGASSSSSLPDIDSSRCGLRAGLGFDAGKEEAIRFLGGAERESGRLRFLAEGRVKNEDILRYGVGGGGSVNWSWGLSWTELFFGGQIRKLFCR